MISYAMHYFDLTWYIFLNVSFINLLSLIYSLLSRRIYQIVCLLGHPHIIITKNWFKPHANLNKRHGFSSVISDCTNQSIAALIRKASLTHLLLLHSLAEANDLFFLYVAFFKFIIEDKVV